MTQRDVAGKLLDKATHDLAVLRKWRTDAEIADEIMGFHAQQAAEKMLKAVLACNEVDFIFTHRLADLLDQLKDQNINVPERFENVRYLTPFAVELRYDFFEEDNEPLDREEIYKLLTDLHSWVTNIITSKE